MKKENIKAIIKWLEDEGCINCIDGLIYQISDGEFEEYYKDYCEENKSEYKIMSKDEFAISICMNALREAGVEEKIIDLCVDWDNQESTDKALEYFRSRKKEHMKLYTACRETGDFIEEVYSIQEGKELIKEYEEIDRDEGDFKENFYAIVDEDHMEVDE